MTSNETHDAKPGAAAGAAPPPPSEAQSQQATTTPSRTAETPNADSASRPQATPHASSHTSIDTAHHRKSRQEYMDSLQPPSNEEFARISEIQLNREVEHKRRSRELKRQSAESARHKSTATPADDEAAHRPNSSPSKDGRTASPDDALRAKAASIIQRTYRGYRVRREMKGLGVDASTRWSHALREAQFRELTRPRARVAAAGDAEGIEKTSALGGQTQQQNGDGPRAHRENKSSRRPSPAMQNWIKATKIARRAGGDADEASDLSPASSTSSSSGSDQPHAAEEREAARKRREEAKAQRRKDAKTMGLQYFLEMVDLKHRYGSNLRTYHEEWKRADTNDNFFYWLDHGDGRFVDISACPRERLDREQVRYLSRDERRYYLVKVDAEGRLCWAKNGARIDTTQKWKDSIHGIVPADDDQTPAFRPTSTDQNQPHDSDSSGESSGDDDDDEPSESELEAARAAKYATPGLDNAKGVKKVSHVSAATIFNKLLRKSVKKNTWIFVADTSFRLYVGIKSSGAFQHSSFLQGGRISAAGLIKIRNGRLASLSPLSGHYRPPASNFRAFVRSLREERVDMSRVSISKSYAVLVGLEVYVSARRRGKDAVRKVKERAERVVHPDRAREREEEERDRSESAARERELLEQQRDENRAGLMLMRKLHIAPRVPEGQKGGGESEEREAEEREEEGRGKEEVVAAAGPGAR